MTDKSTLENNSTLETAEQPVSVWKSIASAVGNVFRSLWLMVLFGTACLAFMLGAAEIIRQFGGDAAEVSDGFWLLLFTVTAVGLITGICIYFGKKPNGKERGRKLTRAVGSAAVAEYLMLALSLLVQDTPLWDYAIGYNLSMVLLALVPVAGIVAGVISWMRYGREKEMSKSARVARKVVGIIAAVLAAAQALVLLFAIIWPYVIGRPLYIE